MASRMVTIKYTHSLRNIMKSNYITNRPLMKMSSLEMMSSRPPHETRKTETIMATAIVSEKRAEANRRLKK